MRRLVAVMALAAPLAACAAVPPIEGNDTGGIIAWSPQHQRDARAIAEAECRRYDKAGRVTSSDRRYGGYIAYACVFDGPRRRGARYPHF